MRPITANMVTVRNARLNPSVRCVRTEPTLNAALRPGWAAPLAATAYRLLAGPARS